MKFEWDESKNELNNASNTNKPSRTDWSKLNEMTDDLIDTSDSPELSDDFFEQATLRLPEPVSIALDIDPDVFAWFEAQGDVSKLMNAALRIYAEAHRKAV